MHIANTDLGTLFPLALGTATGNRRWAEGPAAVFDAFLDLGGNVIDTARVYSALSKSEEAIGKWFRESGKRSRVILVSKGGHPPLFPFPRMHHPRLGAKEMRKDLEASLLALGTDCIDIYLYHRDNPKEPAAALAEVMNVFR